MQQTPHEPLAPKKIKVGVFMGGRSVEKEVSFNSGRTICDHLDQLRYDIIPLFQKQSGELFILPPRFLHRGKISDFEHRLEQEAQSVSWDDLKTLIDFAYIALHGRYAEDGTIQGFLEVLGIPYLGAKVFASAVGMDKIVQKDFLRMAGIEVPREVVVKPTDIAPNNLVPILERMRANAIAFPCIIKPYKEGSSLGMSVVRSPEHLLDALTTASNIHPGTQQPVLIEEKVSGMEFTCIIVMDYTTNTPLFFPPTEVVPEAGSDFFDYDQKYMPGRASKYTPARCSAADTQRIQDTCYRVMQTLEFTTIARTDGFLSTDGRVVIIDPNSLTGMGPASFFFRQAAEYGMSHTQLINHLIETELYRYRMLSKES